MPSLPFDFEDVRNANPFDKNRTTDTAQKSADPAVANQNAAQGFLAKRLNQLRDNLNSTDGLIDLGMAANPVLRYVDMAHKFFGGKGVAAGFRDGVTQSINDERSGQSEIRLPPMPY